MRSKVIGLMVARRRREGRPKRQMVGRNECREIKKIEGKGSEKGGGQGFK